MSPPVIPPPVDGRAGSWSVAGRIPVTITWRLLPGDRSVELEARDDSTGAHWSWALFLTDTNRVERPLGVIMLCLWLHREHGELTLNAELPLTSSELFSGPIACWRAPRAPWGPEPEDETVIKAPPDQVDLFPFVWLHPPSARERTDIVLRFARLSERRGLKLYEQLQMISGKNAPTEKREAATKFRDGGEFVTSLSMLTAPLQRFPALRHQLGAIEAELPLDVLTAAVETLLGEPLAAFFASEAWTTERPNTWQSLFALALVGAPADAALADGLVDVLRVAHFLEVLQAGNPALMGRTGRLTALSAVVVFPDVVAADAPAPGTPGAQASEGKDSCEVLGVGSVKMARQSLVGYLPGEVAEVVNVLPRERRERMERTTTVTTERTAESEQRDMDDDRASTAAASSELASAVQEVMAAEGITRDLSNVTPSYDNLNLMLNGKWSGGDSGATWCGLDRSRFAQGLTERAARHLAERVARQRGRVRRELWERHDTSLIDNSASDARLVGIYRWLDRVVRVQVEERGRRLVVAFSLDRPAERWLDRLERLPPEPLRRPTALPAFDVKDGQGYTCVDASNYQSWGARYGLCDLEPPPPPAPAAITLVLSLDRVTRGDLQALRVPEGYEVTSGTVTCALGDARYGLICAVRGESVSISPVTPGVLSVAVPAVPADPSVTPPSLPSAVVQVTQLAKIKNATGPISITVTSTAPVFQVTVEVTCALASVTSDAPPNAPSPTLVAWQMRTYDRLLQAWESRARAYAAALAARIDRARADRPGEIQRRALENGCVRLLGAVGAESKPENRSRICAPAFGWREMTWHYESEAAGSPDPWPEAVPTEAARPSSDRLFERFLEAGSARVLLPVRAGWERWLLFYLQFQRPWPGGQGHLPALESAVLLLEELLEEEPLDDSAAPPREPRWFTVRIPTPLLYLQEGPEPPRFLDAGAAEAESAKLTR